MHKHLYSSFEQDIPVYTVTSLPFPLLHLILSSIQLSQDF